MPLALGDLNLIAVQAVHKAVHLVNPAAPKARKVVFQRFRFSYPLVRVPFYVLDEKIDALERLFVLGLLVKILFPCGVVPDQHVSPQ